VKKVKLYIACSLDGYIAKKDGEVDWLNDLPDSSKTDHGYNSFASSIDTVIIGRKTYQQVLGFDVPWPYIKNKTLVVSRDPNLKTETNNTSVLSSNLKTEIEKLKGGEGKDIWLIGGGELITSFLDLHFIDVMILCMIPIILGEGIPLFPGKPPETKFKMVKSDPYPTGIVNLTYERTSS